MSEAIDNARNLRAIGQDLEARGISQFELMPATDGYLVRIPYGATRPDETIETDSQGISRRRAGSSRPLELAYSLAAIDKLDEKGRLKRGTGSGMPDFFSLSQCLRALGVVIDAKRGQLLQLDRNTRTSTIPSIVVQYQTSTGERVREEHSLPNLYDYCVHLYKTRSLISHSVESVLARSRMVN
ncbi:MAG TPA: hypothetical protein VGK77_12695 [Candidatus Binatia bacterium]|jgi:hypothetical protein